MAFGLHVIIKPIGSKLWYQKYRFDGKDKCLAHGAYPIVSLSDALKLCESVKALLNQGIDPRAKKQQEKQARQVGKRFEEVARSWYVHQDKLSGGSESYTHSNLRVIETYLLPTLKDRLLIDFKIQDLLIELKSVESEGYLDTIIRLKCCLTSINFALQNGIIEHNSALDLQGAVKTPKKQYDPALPLERQPELFERIDLYSRGRARQLTLFALKLNIYLFVRPSELLKNRLWSDFRYIECSYRGA